MKKQIILKPKRDESLKRFHTWIFSGAVAKLVGNPEDGDIVDILNSENEFVARGHFQTGSIVCRVLTFENEKINDDFWTKKIRNAYALREKLNLTENDQTTVYRLVHGEGDMLPGLIIDIYGNIAVIQSHSVGMYKDRNIICKTIKEIYGDKIRTIYDKSANTLPNKASLNAKNEYIYGEKGNDIVLEYGNKFIVNCEDGQKTGFFIDQRENRKITEKYSNNKKVLNTFCYTGGFSVSALKGGANMVHSVDSSEKAIELTNKNIEINFGNTQNHNSFVQDTFDFLRNSENNFYDIIVLDPPAFAKHNSSINNALQAYKRLNLAAFSKIKSGGIVFTFSCSQVIDKINFRNTIFSAAAISRRKVRILQQLSQPADHPINIYHPESEYLKGLILYIE